MAGELVLLTGATGHVGFKVLVDLLKAGYSVRASVRRAEQGETLKTHKKVAPYASKFESVVVPDITIDGAFDSVLDGVVYIEHIASPLPNFRDDFEKNIVEPAIHGTTSILNSALKSKSIRRVVITSSVLAVVPSKFLLSQDPDTVYTPQSRVRPLPTGPWNHPAVAYNDSKALALDATEQFIRDKTPHFSIVSLMPGLIIGVNDLVTDVSQITSGSNGEIMKVLLGTNDDSGHPAYLVGITDVSRIHVAALNEELVVGNKDIILDTHRDSFDDAARIVREALPEAAKQGLLPLNGHARANTNQTNTDETISLFGPLDAYESDVIALAKQYLELKAAAN